MPNCGESFGTVSFKIPYWRITLDSGSESSSKPICWRSANALRMAMLSQLMAARPRPCAPMRARFCSNSTSWALQNGHQSAER